MKKTWITVWILALIASTYWVACDPIKDVTEKQKFVLNPLHEQNPPIAKNVFIQKMRKPTKEGNMLLMAEFDKGVLDQDFLVMKLGEEEVVFLDNGKGGDEKAGDLIFTTIVQQDENQLIEKAQALNAFDPETRRVQKFIGRVGTLEPFKDTSKLILNSKNFQNFGRFLLTNTADNVCSIAPSPNLRSHSLMITDLSVVEDPTRTFLPCPAGGGTGNPSGVWTFWELMRQMASPSPSAIASDLETSIFIMKWLQSWKMTQVVNGEVLPMRSDIDNIIDPWLAKSQALGTTPGVLDQRWSPFKLTAIVNRMDLSGNSGYGFSNAGEGRFIFSVLDINSSSPACTPLGNGFNVIFEYGINKTTCSSVKAYAQEWYDLKNQVLGSSTYLTALENITKQFTESGTNPAKPNENSINQIRTNEFALDSPWELREFNLFQAGTLSLTSNLGMVTVKQEPALKYNTKTLSPDVNILADFVNTNTAAIHAENYDVPLTHGGQDFLGGKSHTIFNPLTHFWDGTAAAGTSHITDNKSRFIFSLTTCSACHGGETKTFFTHVDPVGIGTEATLSGFLTGLGSDDEPAASDDDNDPQGLFFVNDAAGRPDGTSNPAIRGFNDLERRACKLEHLVARNCRSVSPVFQLSRQLTSRPIRMTH